MIGRVWHGWTAPEKADAYEALLKSEIFTSIFAKQVEGFQRIELFRADLGHEVEFMTIMWFTSWDAVKAFAGEDYDVAYVPAAGAGLLSHILVSKFDDHLPLYRQSEIFARLGIDIPRSTLIG